MNQMPNTHLAGFCLKPKKIFFNNLGNLIDIIREYYLGHDPFLILLCFEKENRIRVLET